MANHRPTKPIEGYPVAELPPAPAVEPTIAAPLPAPARSPAAMAQLRFVDPGSMGATVRLDHPFELDGRIVETIDLRRLSVAEVGAIMDGLGDDDPLDPFDFFSVMTGLPAAVLRGLADDDGAEVLRLGRPLLPRFVRQAAFGEASPTGASALGDGSPSQPHATS